MRRVAVGTTRAGIGAPLAGRVVSRDRGNVETSVTHEDTDQTLDRMYSEASDRAARELDYLLSVHPVESWA